MERTTWFVTPTETWAGTGYHGPTPATGLASLGRLLGRIAAQLDRQKERDGLVLVDDVAARQLGAVGDWSAALNSTASAGWRNGQPGMFTAFYADQRPDIYVGVIGPILDAACEAPDEYPWAVTALDGGGVQLVDPARMVATLQAWHRLSGVPWQAGAPVMGIEIMHKTMTPYRVLGRKGQRRPDKRDDSMPAEVSEAVWSPDMWTNRQLCQYWHGYDKRRAGITAAGVAKLSPARLERRRLREFDPTLAGVWLFSCPPWNVKELPHPCGPGSVPYERIWRTTATLDLVAELAREGVISMPDIIDCLVGPARPVLRPFQQTIERVYQCEGVPEIDRPRLRAAAGEVGRAGIGMLNHRHGRSSIWRPDWYWSVNATKRANAWRVAWKIGQSGPDKGLWPVLFEDDAVWYPSDQPDAERAAPSGIEIHKDVAGAYRVLGTRKTTGGRQ